MTACFELSWSPTLQAFWRSWGAAAPYRGTGWSDLASVPWPPSSPLKAPVHWTSFPLSAKTNIMKTFYTIMISVLCCTMTKEVTFTDREFDLLDLSSCHSHSIIRQVTHWTHQVQVRAGLLLKGPVVLHLCVQKQRNKINYRKITQHHHDIKG